MKGPAAKAAGPFACAFGIWSPPTKSSPFHQQHSNRRTGISRDSGSFRAGIGFALRVAGSCVADPPSLRSNHCPRSTSGGFAMRCHAVIARLSLAIPLALWLGTNVAQADDPKPSNSRAEQVQKELAPKLVTFKAEKIRLSEALKRLAQQTGIEVEDRRRAEGSGDPELKLDLKGVTFWQALDAIAKEADLRVGLYQRGGAIALVDGPHVQLPVSYDGLFRTVVRRVTTAHDLETDQRSCIVSLEIAWEPRFRPLFLESRPQSLVVTDDNKT